MRKIVLSGLCLLILLLASSMAFAADSGAGQAGTAIQLGYDGAYLSYKEDHPNDGGILDKDTGWLNGVNTEARYDGRAAGVPFL